MEIISKLCDMIEEELNDAEKYIKCAMNYKEERQQLAQTFARLSTEEMNHVTLLHDQVTNIISDYRAKHGEPPEKMQAIYDYVHKKHMNKANEIKVMQALFKS